MGAGGGTLGTAPPGRGYRVFHDQKYPITPSELTQQKNPVVPQGKGFFMTTPPSANRA